MNVGWGRGHTPGRGETTGFVVARGHQDALGIGFLQEVQHNLEGPVVFQYFAHLRSRVIEMPCMIDPAALNHKEEALVTVLGRLLQRRQRRGCHLAQARIHIRHVSPINLKRHVGSGEQSQRRQAHIPPQPQLIKPGAITLVGPSVLLPRNAHHVHIIGPAAPLGPAGQEMAAPPAQDQIHGPPERALANLLQGDLVHLHPVVDVRGEARGGGVGHVGGDDQARLEAGALGGLEDGAARPVAGEHADGAVVALAAAREGGGAGGRVGHEGVGGPRARGAPEVAVEGEHVVDGEGRGELAEGAGQGERGRTHAVRDHKDEVAF